MSDNPTLPDWLSITTMPDGQVCVLIEQNIKPTLLNVISLAVSEDATINNEDGSEKFRIQIWDNEPQIVDEEWLKTIIK